MPQETNWQNAGELLVALGANMPSPFGQPAETLVQALKLISRRIGPVVAQSRLWRTPAHPPGAGPDFVNAAAHVRTALPVAEALARLHTIEAEAGRERRQRWSARPLDLDLVAAGARVLPDAATQARWRDLPPEAQMREAPDTLILPHPRVQDRAFVLVPLAEVAAGWHHPLTGEAVAQMLSRIPAEQIAAIIPFATG